MFWLFQLTLAWLLLIALPWFLAVPTFVVLFFITLGMRTDARRSKAIQPSEKSSAPAPQAAFLQLTLLRQTLHQQYQQGLLAPGRYRSLRQQIAQVEAKFLQNLGLDTPTEQQQLDTAWRILQAHHPEIGTPPWQPAKPAPVVPPPAPVVAPRPAPKIVSETPAPPVAPVVRPRPAPPVVTPPSAPTPRPALPVTPPPRRPEPRPSALKRWQQVFHNFVGEVLLPFLWENIGWFIGGFCFVSGSIFLVFYTSGYSKALAVVGTLSLYAMLLFWGGYQIRRRRPSLFIAASVLLGLGMLIIPLALAASTRLILTGLNEGLLLGVAVLVNGLLLLLFTGLARLASGSLERPLLAGHPGLFMSLAALQLLAPVLHWLPYWPLLAALHGLLLGLLAYSLRRFAQDWLRSLFIDQQLIAWYAAGTLIYAALVSFVHLSVQSGVLLPKGYAGPFLMLLSGLLFYADTHIQRWVDKRAWLGRFSFVVYGLSVIAVLPGWLSGGFWPLALSLMLGVVLYGSMLVAYLSVSPLLLLLAACAWLYGLLILGEFPAEAHSLLSIPGLLGGFWLQRWLRQRQAMQAVAIVRPLLLTLIPGLALWSLYQAVPGWAAMLTPLGALLMLLVVLELSVADLWANYQQSVPLGRRCYLPVLFTLLTLAYAPLLIQPWGLQFSIGLLGLTSLWLWLARLGLQREVPRCHHEVFANTALFSLLLAPLLGFFTTDGWFHLAERQLLLAALLFAAGGLWLWLSLLLRSRLLVYGLVPVWGGSAACLILSQHWVLSGSSFSLLGLGLAGLLWYLERRQLQQMLVFDLLDFDPAQLPRAPWRFRLLGLWPLTEYSYDSVTEMLLPPLRHILLLAWLGGVGKALWLSAGLLQVRPEQALSAWPTLALGLAAVMTVVVAGRQRWLGLVPLIVLLLVAAGAAQAGLVPGWRPGAALYLTFSGLLWWAVGVWLLLPLRRLWQVLDWTGRYPVPGGHHWAEHNLHWSGIWLAVAGLSLAWLGTLTHLLWSLPPILALLWLAGQRYHLQRHAYLLVAGVSLGVGALCSVWLGVDAWRQLSPAQLVLFPLGIALALAALGAVLSALPSGSGLQPRFSTPASLLYVRPLYHSAWLLYGLALWLGFNPLTGYAPLWVGATNAGWLWFALALSALPLFYPPKQRLSWLPTPQHAAVIRGLLLPVFGSFAYVSALEPGFWKLWLDWVPPLLVLASVLWSLGYTGWPRWSRHLPNWAVEPVASLWWGRTIYAVTLLASLLIYLVLPPSFAPDLFYVWLWLAQAGLLLPLLRNSATQDSAYADFWRGLLLPLLLSLALFELTRWFGLHFGNLNWSLLLMAWSFALVSVPVWWLPRWNAQALQAPAWYRAPIDSHSWPHWGLMLIGLAVLGSTSVPDWQLVTVLGDRLQPLLAMTLKPLLALLVMLEHLSLPLLLGFSVYLLVYSRGVHAVRERRPWLYLAALGLSLSIPVLLLRAFPLIPGLHLGLVLGLVLWFNGLLRAGQLRAWLPASLRRFWPAAALHRIAWLSLWWLLAALTITVGLGLVRAALSGGLLPNLSKSALGLGLLLSLSFAHLLWRWPSRLAAHGWLLALTLLLALLLGRQGGVLLWLTLLNSLLAGLLFVGLRHMGAVGLPTGLGCHPLPGLRRYFLHQVLHLWLPLVYGAALLGLLLLAASTGERLAALSVQAGLALLVSLRSAPVAASRWLGLSAVLALGALHWFWVWGLLPPGLPWTVLLPWYALQAAGLAWVWRWFDQRLQASLPPLPWTLPLLPWVALAEWAVFLFGFFSLGIPSVTWAGSLDLWAGGLAGLLLTGLWWRSFPTWGGLRIYGMAALLGLLGVYGRLCSVGFTPLNVGDTSALMLVALGCVSWARLWAERNSHEALAVYRLGLLLPALAVLSVPLQLESTSASLALLAAASLYLLLPRQDTQSLPVYLGVLALNLGCYLWVPGIAARSGLLQVYTIPAALSVLLMLQLHHRELRPSVAHAVRLSALSVLYASATLDVFLQSGLGIFLLALGLSLTGVVAGIGLRIRAFLYSGMAFLILNVLGQLIRFYPEDTLGKAVILMVLGGAITGGMIAFSLQREVLMRRWQRIQAELAAWA